MWGTHSHWKPRVYLLLASRNLHQQQHLLSWGWFLLLIPGGRRGQLLVPHRLTPWKLLKGSSNLTLDRAPRQCQRLSEKEWWTNCDIVTTERSLLFQRQNPGKSLQKVSRAELRREKRPVAHPLTSLSSLSLSFKSITNTRKPCNHSYMISNCQVCSKSPINISRYYYCYYLIERFSVSHNLTIQLLQRRAK